MSKEDEEYPEYIEPSSDDFDEQLAAEILDQAEMALEAALRARLQDSPSCGPTRRSAKRSHSPRGRSGSRDRKRVKMDSGSGSAKAPRSPRSPKSSQPAQRAKSPDTRKRAVSSSRSAAKARPASPTSMICTPITMPVKMKPSPGSGKRARSKSPSRKASARKMSPKPKPSAASPRGKASGTQKHCDTVDAEVMHVDELVQEEPSISPGTADGNEPGPSARDAEREPSESREEP